MLVHGGHWIERWKLVGIEFRGEISIAAQDMGVRIPGKFQ